MSSFIFIHILIFLFTLLLSYQIFLAYFSTKNIEGLTTCYKEYDTDNPNNVMMLAQQNAGNISALKTELMDSMKNLKGVITDISGNVANLQTQINDLATAQKDTGEQMAGSEPLEITT